MKDEELIPILYALTLRDRGPAARERWISKGFARIHRRPDALLRYWRSRLATDAAARAMAAEVHAEYTAALKARQRPGIAAQARNLAGAVAAEGKAILQGKEPVPVEERERRLSICMAPCKSLDPASARCNACGCYVKRKVGWRSQSCPLGKW